MFSILSSSLLYCQFLFEYYENLHKFAFETLSGLLVSQGEVEDYQSSKRKEFKNFKDNLESFWDHLVHECQHGPLFDQVLFDKCVDYIIALSWLVKNCKF